jgi:SAM-dependent methyltransferase
MANTEPGTAPGYLLDNAWDRAQRRLELLHDVHDPGTIARLDRLGVAGGWRVFVPGAGGGSIVRWLGRRVGQAGRVLATDIDPRFLGAVDEPAVEVRRHDIVHDPLPQELFDLVQVRLLLIHLPEREAVLKRLVALLAPGGRILVEEYDFSFAAASPDPTWAEAARTMTEVIRRLGPDYGWARVLPRRLRDLGLDDVGGEVDLPYFRGGSPTAQFHWLTGEQARDRLLGVAGFDRDLFQRAQAALLDPDRWFLPPGMVAAWGRHPDR